MASVFGGTFWWALGLLGVAFAASLALPKRKPEPETVSGDVQQPVALAA
jgi:hypothetical protein